MINATLARLRACRYHAAWWLTRHVQWVETASKTLIGVVLLLTATAIVLVSVTSSRMLYEQEAAGKLKASAAVFEATSTEEIFMKLMMWSLVMSAAACMRFMYMPLHHLLLAPSGSTWQDSWQAAGFGVRWDYTVESVNMTMMFLVFVLAVLVLYVVGLYLLRSALFCCCCTRAWESNVKSVLVHCVMDNDILDHDKAHLAVSVGEGTDGRLLGDLCKVVAAYCPTTKDELQWMQEEEEL